MKIWTTAKHGHTSQENEDAANGDDHFVAVADGATEAIFSRIWARELVNAMTEVDVTSFLSEPNATFWQRTEMASFRWQAQLSLGPQPWFVQQKMLQGSGAALALLMLNRQQRRWYSIAIGDVIIVQLRDHQKMCAWPLDHSAQFNTSPTLVGSKPTRDRSDVPSCEGIFIPGDQFLVMTDALAAWSLHCDEISESQWDHLLGIGTSLEWESFVQKARLQGMRNDDVTLIQLEIVEDVNSVPTSGSI